MEKRRKLGGGGTTVFRRLPEGRQASAFRFERKRCIPACLAGHAGFGQSGTGVTERPREDRGLVFAAMKAMVAGAVQDRVASVGAAVVAVLLLLTAWGLGVAALVLWLAGWLGMVGALASVTAGLVVLALAIVGLTRLRNKGAADQRATTRALWAATAVNAASSLLRRGPAVQADPAPAGESGGSHRSALLIGGGLALILLGILFPSGSGEGSEDGGPDAAPGPAAPGSDDAA